MKVDVHYPELYEVSRQYGGPEEGGWWWDLYTVRHTFKARLGAESSESEREALARLAKYINKLEGNRPISSVLSTGYIQWAVSAVPGQIVTKETPRYE